MRIQKYATGVVTYFNDDNDIHREDGPAIIEKNGTERWCKHGKLHRENGPAVIYPDSSKEWWYEGQLHREDGPAIIKYYTGWHNYTIQWYHYGKQLRDYMHWLYQTGKTEEEITIMILKYGNNPNDKDFLS